MPETYYSFRTSLLLSVFLTAGCQHATISSMTEITVHGHRGSRGTHPENTLPAFEEAQAAGAHVLELDLQLTKDGVPVVSHEPVLEAPLCRYRGGKPIKSPVAIHTLPVKELAKFECGHTRNPRFPDQQPIPGTAIPTLEDFLKWSTKLPANIEFNIETKMTAAKPEWVADPVRFTDAVLALLNKYHAVQRTILQSFDFRTLKHAAVAEPALRLSCLFETEKNFCDLTAAVGAKYASPDQTLVTKQEVAKCHAKGIHVVPWTANTEAEWKHLIDLGVDAIITDYPRRLTTYLGSTRAKR